MGTIRVNPNRMEVMRLRKRLVLCRRGHKLLKQKQDELFRILNELIGKAENLREETEKKGNIHNYGFLETSSDLDQAFSLFSQVIPGLVKLCEVENQLAIISEEIEKTRRRVNALEHILIPDLEETIREVIMKLEELERGSLVRLMKVKEMVR